MGPTTRSHTGDEWDTKVTQISEDVSMIKQTLGDLDHLKQCFQDMDDIKNHLQVISQHLGLIDKGKNQEYHSEAPHSSHYENTHNSHSPWGSPNSWNKFPKVEMHKFDGSDPAGWVSQMEHYLSLHDIQDDETKLHVGFCT
jgi:hypothetical protein